MSAPKAERTIIQEGTNRWNATHAPAAGTTCVASVAAVGSGRHIMTHVMASLRNMTGSDVTYTLSVRDASIAGTALASFDFLCLANDVTGLIGEFPIVGVKNSALFAEFGTPAASVTQKVSISGWTEDPR